MLQQEVSRQWAWKAEGPGLCCEAAGSRCRLSLEEEAAGDGAEEGAAGVVGTKCRRLLAGANSFGGLI